MSLTWDQFVEKAEGCVMNNDNKTLLSILSTLVYRQNWNLLTQIFQHEFYSNFINLDEFINKIINMSEYVRYIKELYKLISVEKLFIQIVKNNHHEGFLYLINQNLLKQEFMDKLIFSPFFTVYGECLIKSIYYSENVERNFINYMCKYNLQKIKMTFKTRKIETVRIMMEQNQVEGVKTILPTISPNELLLSDKISLVIFMMRHPHIDFNFKIDLPNEKEINLQLLNACIEYKNFEFAFNMVCEKRIDPDFYEIIFKKGSTIFVPYIAHLIDPNVDYVVEFMKNPDNKKFEIFFKQNDDIEQILQEKSSYKICKYMDNVENLDKRILDKIVNEDLIYAISSLKKSELEQLIPKNNTLTFIEKYIERIIYFTHSDDDDNKLIETYKKHFLNSNNEIIKLFGNKLRDKSKLIELL